MKKKDGTLIKRCNQKWDIIQSEYLIRSKWLTVRKDWVRTSKGIQIKDFYILEYSDWVNVIAKTTEGKYIMERQYRHGIQQCVYELCAGICDPGGIPIDAAKRELLEETGYSGGTWSLIGKYAPNPSAMTNFCYAFFADGVSQYSEPVQELTEDIQVLLVDETELLELMCSGDILEGVMLAPLWQFFNNK